MEHVRFAVRVTRAPFLTATVVPVLVGAAAAWRDGSFQLGLFGLTLLGALAVHIGLNLTNDYFDHLSGNDALNPQPTPFSGGSRVIQEGLVPARHILVLALTSYGLGAAVGLYLAATRGWPILAIGAVGILLAISHNGPPLKIYYLAPGLGELAVGIGFGPLMVLGTYYVQTQQLSSTAWWAALPVGLLIAAVLLINEFPDVTADRAVGKKTIAVVFGRQRAVWVYAALLAASYGVVLAGVVLGALPAMALLTLLTLPLAARSVAGARRFYHDTTRLLPANAATIQLHLCLGLVLCCSYLLEGILA